MKKLLALLIFATSIVNAQYTVKGTMTPPEKSDWIALYKIEGANQKFITNTTIKFDTIVVSGEKQVLGRFQLNLPETTKPGVYRATYRNSGAGFVDFYFNKENVEFIFNPKYPDESVVFTSSRENKLYNEYLEAYTLVQNKIDANQISFIKSEDKEAKKTYKKGVKELKDIQETYENKSEGMLVNIFIKASQRYNPSSPFDNMKEYLSSTVDNFFKYVDFNNDALYNSSFIIDRITDYVFYLNSSENKQLQQKLYRISIVKVMDIVPNGRLRKGVTEFLISSLADKRNGEAVDWMFSTYYDKLPAGEQDAKFKKDKLQLLSASVGRTAPDFSWKEKGNELTLSTLNDGEKYLLVFWSTACPHCVKDVPKLYEFMQAHKNVSVISFSVEDAYGIPNWNEFIKKIPLWHNVMGTHPTWKWDNKAVKAYNISETPSFFILNQNKKIIASPDQLKDVKEYFEK